MQHHMTKEDEYDEDSPLLEDPEYEEAMRKHAWETLIRCPCLTVILCFVLFVVVSTQDHPGGAAAAPIGRSQTESDEHCEPLLQWLQLFLIVNATHLTVNLILIARVCVGLFMVLDFLLNICYLITFIGGILVVVMTDISRCNSLLAYTVVFFAVVGPLAMCCITVLILLGFATGMRVAMALQDRDEQDRGPEATPDLAAAAEAASKVPGNIRAMCPVCREVKRVKAAVPCGHMLCEECQHSMQALESKELGVGKCPTCRQPVNFFQAVYHKEPNEQEDP